jgi:hypothetical protein
MWGLRGDETPPFETLPPPLLDRAPQFASYPSSVVRPNYQELKRRTSIAQCDESLRFSLPP